MRRRGRIVVAATVAMATVGLGHAPARAQGDEGENRAAKVKAAYLRWIAEYTTWPEGTFASDDAPLVIGVLGDDRSRVAEKVRGRIEGKGLSAQGRRLALLRLPDPGAAEFDDALRGCHLLFLSESESGRWPSLRSKLAQRAIVTVSEIAGFARQRGMIEFVVEADESRVSMHIDLAAVRQARLRLSSKLLGLKKGVKIVRKPGDVAANARLDASRPL